MLIFKLKFNPFIFIFNLSFRLFGGIILFRMWNMNLVFLNFLGENYETII